jgi:SNF2 family DNA or RNA helicase
MSLWPLNGSAMAHQERALKEAGRKPGHAFWIDAGGGKSGVCLAEAVGLWLDGMIDGVVIVGPAGPHAQWVTEQVPLWVKEPFRAIHNHMAPRKVESLFASAKGVMPFLAINYDSIITAKGKALVNRFLGNWPRVYFIFDESTRLKNPKAARTEACIAFARRAAYRRVLSGTPILKSLEDMYSPYDTIQPGATGFRNFFAFRNYYCQMVPIPGARSIHAKRIVGYRNQNELHANVAPYTTRIPSSEFARQSTPTFMRVHCPMNQRQEQTYMTMAAALLADLGNGNILTVDNALTRTAKLLQIASGFIMDDDRNVVWLSDSKITTMNDILDELDEPVIVFAPYIALMDAAEIAIRERADRPVFRYRNRDDVEAWKKEGGALVGNQASGLGIGQNLQKAAATIYLANPFSSEARWQSLARTDRTGQERQVRYWDLVSPNTIDMGVLDILADREDLSRMTLNAIRELIARGAE